jgi:antitoxin StbD
MPHQIFCSMSVSIDELKHNPMAAVDAGAGDAVVVFSDDQPAFYCVPSELFEALRQAMAARRVEGA